METNKTTPRRGNRGDGSRPSAEGSRSSNQDTTPAYRLRFPYADDLADGLTDDLLAIGLDLAILAREMRSSDYSTGSGLAHQSSVLIELAGRKTNLLQRLFDGLAIEAGRGAP